MINFIFILKKQKEKRKKTFYGDYFFDLNMKKEKHLYLRKKQKIYKKQKKKVPNITYY